MTRWISLLLLTVFGAAASQALAQQRSLTVENAWVREGPPNAKVLAGFMTLQNGSSEPVTVTSVSSPQFARIEMHQTVMAGGVARMVPQKQLTVPADGSLQLQPGGYHLMLFEPKSALQAGDAVTLDLHTDRHGTVSAPARVRKATGMAPRHKHHH